MIHLLPWTVYLSFIGAAVILVTRADKPEFHRWVALVMAVACTVLATIAACQYATLPNHTLTTLVRYPWIPSLNIQYFLAADGTSILLVLLTGIVSTAGILFSWNVATRTKEFFALYLLLVGGVYGVFMSFDLFLFMVFYEIAIIPKYFLIAIWGSTNKQYGAMKLALYSFVGSAMALIGILAARAIYGTFDLVVIMHHLTIGNAVLATPSLHTGLFICTFFGFAILAGLWPFHTWAPVGHVAAPTAASMLLAGVVMKLGSYGCLRVAMNLYPNGISGASTLLYWLAAIGIIGGALTALRQTDLKFVIGYSSVSHMGWVLMGILHPATQPGAIFQMFSHGILAGLMFAIVGRMVYDRTHTRDLAELEKMGLGRRLPFAAICFVIASAASMGMPGFSGFPAEALILVGLVTAWKIGFAIAAAISIVFAAAYMLRALQRAFYSTEDASVNEAPFAPITLPEKIGALFLISISILVGVMPNLLIKLIL